MGEERHIGSTFIPASDDSFREERRTNSFIPAGDESWPDQTSLGPVNALKRVNNLLECCHKLCRKVAPMLVGTLENTTIEHKRGLVINVLEQRLLLWGATISDYKDYLSFIIQAPRTAYALSDINGALRTLYNTCTDGHGMQTLEREELVEELIAHVDFLYSKLPEAWHDTTEWALTATLVKTTAPTMIKEEIQAISEHDIFRASLGSSKIGKSFGMMLKLIDESISTEPVPLLASDSLVSSGSYDGIGVYYRVCDKADGPPPTGGFISIRTEWTMEQATIESEDMVYVRMKYQQRLQLPKPDEMRVLVLSGFFEDLATGRVELLYHVPPWASQHSPPVSLRRLIAEKLLPDDIKLRFSIARKLVCAILYFHACEWIHGGIEDGNIIFFEDSENNLNLEEPFFCKFIPSTDALGSIPTTKKSADLLFGNDITLRNVDTSNIWRTVLLIIFERETVATKGPPDSGLKYPGANLDLSKWAEVEQCMSDWSKDADTKYNTLEGNIGSNNNHISRQGLFWKVTRILNLCSPKCVIPKGRIPYNYRGTWSEIPTFGLEGVKRARLPELVESGEEMEGPDTQSMDTGRSSHTNTHHPGESEKQKTQEEIFAVDATHEQIVQWRRDILPRLERIIERLNLPAEESVSIDLLGIGTSREECRRTIVVTCKSTRLVKVRLKKFVYDKSAFSLKVRKGSVQRSSGGGRADQCSRHQERPLPGASIGACLDGEHLPAATYGGLLLVDKHPYGLTVHHLVDSDDQSQEQYTLSHSLALATGVCADYHPDDGESADVDMEEDQLLTGGPHRRYAETGTGCQYAELEGEPSASDVGDDDIMGSQGSTCSPGSLVCEYDDERSSDTDIYMEDDDSSIGDIPGLGKGHDKHIVVVQPAEQDLLDEEKNIRGSITEGYHLGTILASSGIRRVMFESEKHEIDWALIEISDRRLEGRNVIQGSGRLLASRDRQDSEPCSYVETTRFSNLAVHGIGRTSGLQEGRISEAISSIKIHGRKTFSRSWNVTGKIGVGGDSGAWVVDSQSGCVCGHIIAGNIFSGGVVAYINPMELLLRDIKETLKADSVCLPTAAVAAQVGCMVEFRLTECEGSSVDIQPVSPTLSTGGSDDVHSLASFSL